MTDPAKLMSDALHALAATRVAPVDGALPRQVRRRARLAMVRTVLGTAIVIVVVATASVAALERVTDRTPPPVGAPESHDVIAFTSDRDGDADIYTTVFGEEEGATNLTRNDAPEMSPRWSPDGSKIAFSSHRDGEWGVYVMDADGSNVRQLVSPGVEPEWAPDGTAVAFTRPVGKGNETPLSQIFVVRLA
ncbi:MAG TPA: hypothetical protein VIG64_14645, partial [Actinomycetota bacterium]